MFEPKITLFTLVIASFLVGCGGGKSTSNSTNNSTNNSTTANNLTDSNSSSSSNGTGSSTGNTTGSNSNSGDSNNTNSGSSSSSAINDSSPVGTVIENGDGTVSVKYYKYQTGRIVYSTEFHLESLSEGGSVVSNAVGTRTLLFKDYGNIRVIKENNESTTTITIQSAPPSTIVTNRNDLTKYVGGKVFDVKFDDNEIRMTDLTEFVRLISANPQAVADSLTSSLTGNIVVTGTDNVQGFPCEIQESAQLGTTVCVHEKNIALTSMLNSVSENGSTTLNERAISVQFNIEIPESEFSLPSFPIVE